MPSEEQVSQKSVRHRIAMWRAQHLQFLHLSEASLAAPLTLARRTQRLAPEDQKANFTAELCRDVFRRRLAVVDRQFGDGRPCLTGERLRARPAFQRAAAK